MEGHPILGLLAQCIGGLIILVVLADVFLIVLYARIRTGVFSNWVTEWMWFSFCALSKPLTRRRGWVLAACGPATLVVVVALWISMLVCGSALIYWPHLGTSIRANEGTTPHDFVNAIYLATGAISTSGASDLSPKTGAFRLFYAFDSLIGISVLTLTLTYILQIYNALHARNTLALKVHLGTGETGDAAELLAGLGPQGRFDTGYSLLGEIAAEVTSIKEAHHFHSALLYFRFQDPYYAVSRFMLVALDSVTLIKSGLDDEQYGWLKESAGVAQLWRASMRMLTILAITFLPEGLPEAHDPSPQTLDRWTRRYHAALRRLRQAGITTIADEHNGLETYIALRARWDRYICALARFMAREIEQIDPACTAPESSDERQDFTIRLRSAG